MINRLKIRITLSFLAVLFQISCFQPVISAQVAIFGDMIYPVSGNPVEQGVVLIKDGKIEKIGPAGSITIPKDYTILKGKVVTPGLIDARSTVGLTGIYNQDHDQDQLDRTSAIQPELRAIDSFNPKDELVEWVRNLGTTTVHTGHGPGGVFSGQTFIVKTTGNVSETDVVRIQAMQAITLGRGISSQYQSPGTRAKTVALLRTELMKAQEYQKKLSDSDKSNDPSRDLKLESLVRLLTGEDAALIHANTIQDIQTAIRLKKEFGMRVILDGAAEAYLIPEEIKQAGIPVILHPSMVRTYGDNKNSNFESASILSAAGVPFTLQTGYEGYVPKVRVLLYEASIYAANGLGMERTLQAITLDAAKILEIDKQTGSLEAGKDADVVIFDGDPFEYLTKVCHVIIGGRVVHSACQSSNN